MTEDKEAISFRVFECCNKSNDILRHKYNNLNAEEETLKKEIQEREARLRDIRREYTDLNEATVNVVLDYVRSYSSTDSLSKNEIDTYLCHCQNKLNGNINGIFLHFNDPMETKNESTNNKS